MTRAGATPTPRRRKAAPTIRRVATWAALGVAAASGMAVLRALAPDRPVLGRVWLLGLAVLLVLRLGYRTRTEELRPRRSPYDRAARRGTGEPGRPEDLRRLEQALYFATMREADLHARVRPVLREVAELRLAARRGISLDGDPAAAAAALGPDLWELVRADRRPPADQTAPGATPAALGAMLDRLEAI
ncbi:MAG TPA: hypothetical protein VG276_03800 [Actinomycetes bacterium]|jgi:hypothetical protein|nr:hypothetical protein [Actinomycetes bacterium]